MTEITEAPSVKLDPSLTAQILEEFGKKASVNISDSFVQVLITRPDGTTMLGIDGRATCSENVKDQPPGKILEVTNLTTILSSGSCFVTVVRNGKLETWILPDEFCAP